MNDRDKGRRISRRELAKLVSNSIGRQDLTATVCDTVIEAAFNTIVDLVLTKEMAVSIRKVGKFYPRKLAARLCHDVRNGEMVQIPSRVTVGFKMTQMREDTPEIDDADPI